MDAYPVRPELAGLAPQNGHLFGWDVPIPLTAETSAWIEFGVIAVLGVASVVLTAISLWKALKVARSKKFEDVLTVIAAAIATGVSAQGMWQFAGDVLGFNGPLKVLLFAFIEVAVITSAVRARRNMRENYAAGIDGLAVWVLTGLSAVLSAMDAASLAEAIFRLAAPLVAAWLWERGMAIERVRLTGRSRIHWRLTPERAMVRLGLAESSDRTAEEVDAHRRLTRVALAAWRLRSLRQSDGSGRQIRRAEKALNRTLEKAVEHAGLARDDDRMAALLDQTATLFNGGSLADLDLTSPFSRSGHAALPATEAATEEPAEPDVEPTPAKPALPPAPAFQLIPLLIHPEPERRPEEETRGVSLETVEWPGRRGRAWSRPEFLTWPEPVATGEQSRDRKPATEQERRDAVKHWVKLAKGGRVLKKPDLAAWAGRSETWAYERIREARDVLADQGWDFDSAGRPIRPETGRVLAVNGSRGASSRGGAA